MVNLDRSPAPWRQEARHLGRSGTILAVNQLAQLAIPFVTLTMTGQLGVPVIVIGGDIMVGFDREKVAAKLGIAA